MRLWNTGMKTCLLNFPQAFGLSVRNFSSPSAHNRRKWPFGEWRAWEERQWVEMTSWLPLPVFTAYRGRSAQGLRTVRALITSDCLRFWPDCLDPDTVDGPRSMGGRSAAWDSILQILSTFWFWISNLIWCSYMDISTNPRVSMHAYTHYGFEECKFSYQTT